MLDRPIRHSRWQRGSGAALAVVGCLSLAGCGGSGHSSSATRSSSSLPSTSPRTTTTVIGPGDRGAKLIGLLAKSNTELSDVRVDCPPGPVAAFPFHCRITATAAGVRIPRADVAKHPKEAELKKPHPVAGTLGVFGIYAPTGTYEYQLHYAPTR
ncbi:MAG: hypothetical protein M3065_08705 [Actinomycetota bacterium]|nr:hypothetical protein [Actinomycetota bacterium]